MRSKNKEIQSMIGRYRADAKANINPLSMLLNGVIDAAVMGGISNYEKVRIILMKYIYNDVLISKVRHIGILRRRIFFPKFIF